MLSNMLNDLAEAMKALEGKKVKVVVTNQPHSRRHTVVDLVSGVSALLAWFPASWASKIALCFLGEEGGVQAPQEVSFTCPHRVFEGLQRDAVDQVLQAVKFTDKNAPGLSLALDEEFQVANCFAELIRGYTMGVVEPYIMMDLQPTGPTRVNLEVIVPSPTGLTPEMWKQTATLCPLEWPSNYSLLRLWHSNKSLHQYAAQLKQQKQHRHMFTQWEVNPAKLASRVFFQRPAHYLPETTLRQHVTERMEIWHPMGAPLRVKRHAIHHWLYSLCTEDTWKATTRVHDAMIL